MTYSKCYADDQGGYIKLISDILMDPVTYMRKIQEEDIDRLRTATSAVKFRADFMNTIKFSPKLTAISKGCTLFEYVLTGSLLVINVKEDGGIGKKTLLTIGGIAAGKAGGHIGATIGNALCPVFGAVVGSFIGSSIASLLYEGFTNYYFDVSGPCVQ